MINAFFHPIRSFFNFIARLIKLCITVAVLLCLLAVSINLWVISSTHDDIRTATDYTVNTASCILVLGAGINADGTPDNILRERLDTACALYGKGAAPTVVISGGRSEVVVMGNYLVSQGIPSSVIIEDAEGYDTFHSMINIQSHAQGSPVIVVSQRFHLYRSLFIAHHLSQPATGCVANDTDAVGFQLQEREFFARIKDFCQLTLPVALQPLLYTLYKHLSPSATDMIL